MQWTVPIAAVATLALVASCTPLTRVRITAADNGHTVELSRGEEVAVTLESNQSTGYRWTLVDSSPSIVVPVGEPTYAQAGSAGMVGAGGTEIWILRAVEAGEQSVRFEYRRAWEPGPPARLVTFRVQVD